MTIHSWLVEATQKLVQAGIGTARLDALVLLEDELNTNRAQLLAHPELKLTMVRRAKLGRKLARRGRHEPLAYIRGHTEFYGREFIITNAVLEPRAESEAMLDLLKSLPLSQNSFASAGLTKSTASITLGQLSKTPPNLRRTIQIADVGTGSGALGITAALEIGCTVELIEIDDDAIRVAKRNVKKFATDNSVIKSDLLAQTTTKYDILLCNLPYVPSNFHINPAALNEPKIAIFGGLDGLDIYRRLFTQLENLKQQPQYVLTESLPPQHTKLAQIAKEAGFKLTKAEDFIQVFVRSS